MRHHSLGCGASLPINFYDEKTVQAILIYEQCRVIEIFQLSRKKCKMTN